MLKILLAISLVFTSCAPRPQMTVVKSDITSFDLKPREEMYRLNRRSVKIEWVCNLVNVGTMGSGVVVGHKDGKTIVATAAHVTDFIEDSNCSIVAKDWTGASGFGEVLASDEDTDVAIVSVGELIGEVAPLNREPYLGKSVTCVGWPSIPFKDYEGQSVTTGSVSTILGDFIRVSADLYFGNSGGSCFSKAGEVVGIVSHFMLGGMYYIAHVDNVKKLLD